MSLFYFQTTNPCICSSPPPGDPPCPDDCNCLKLCNINVNGLSDEAVGPCAATGTIDVSDDSYGHDLCACGANTVIWGIEDYDKEIFTSATINNAGVLTWVTGGPDTAGEYGCVIVCVSCGNLKAYFFVLIGVKDLCYGCSGASCEHCDPCTGEIEAFSVNASLTGGTTSSNSSISGS